MKSKFLCVCDGGNVRSHCMAVVLKEHGYEAIAVGRWNISQDTMTMLCGWADVVILMEPHMIEHVPTSFHKKIYHVNVGPDIYGVGINPHLRQKITEGTGYLFFHLANN